MNSDVIVVGLGAMGSAACYQLAKRGAKVIGIDRYSPPHTLGSTHGDTRITRLAIGEGEHFVPFAIRSHEIWRELESETGADLMTTTGGLIMSAASASTLHGKRKLSADHYLCCREIRDQASGVEGGRDRLGLSAVRARWKRAGIF